MAIALRFEDGHLHLYMYRITGVNGSNPETTYMDIPWAYGKMGHALLREIEVSFGRMLPLANGDSIWWFNPEDNISEAFDEDMVRAMLRNLWNSNGVSYVET